MSFLLGAGIAVAVSLWAARPDPPAAGSRVGDDRRAAALVANEETRDRGRPAPGGDAREAPLGAPRGLPAVVESDLRSAGDDARPPSAPPAAAWAAGPRGAAAALPSRSGDAAAASPARSPGGAADGSTTTAAAAARARALDAEIAAGPPDAALVAQARRMRATVQALPLPGRDALDEATCGPTACRFRVPPALAGTLQVWLANAVHDEGLFAHQPAGGDGSVLVYLRTATHVALAVPAATP